VVRTLLALMSTLTSATAADTTPGFHTRTFTNADGSKSDYVVFVPHSYDGTKPTPTILFLHGMGESKGGQKMPVEQGLGTYIKKHEKTFPYLTVIPQSEKRTWQVKSADGQRAMAILDEVEKAYKTDKTRTILTGLSMGGYGAWSIATAFPERWAALVPICGGGDPKQADKLIAMPIWAFHGDKDTAVKVERSREMIDAITKAGGKPKYTEYAGVDHFSWDPAYATPELWTWLAEQRKK
jgi:predicted peptidase